MSTVHLALTAGLGLLALVWTVIAHEAWRGSGSRRLMLIATLAAIHLSLQALFGLVPVCFHMAPPVWLIVCYVLADHSFFGLVVLFRRGCRAIALDDRPPSRRWLAVTYGSAVLVGILTVIFPLVLPGRTFEAQLALYKTVAYGYVLLLFVLALRDVSREVERGWWRPGGGAHLIRRADIVALATGLLALGGAVLWMSQDPMNAGDGPTLLILVIGVALTIPWAGRAPGAVVRGVVVTIVLLAAAAALLHAAGLARERADPVLRPLITVGLTVGLVVVLGPGRTLLGVGLDRLLFRQSRRRSAELQAIVHAISPEVGVTAVCEQALAGLARVLRLRGAAFVFRDRRTVVHGDLDLGPVERVWPRDAALDALVADTFDELPPRLRRDLAKTDVAGFVPVATPRRQWGHLMVSTPLLYAPYTDEELRAGRAFADQLGLVLDAAELIARAAAVERSLAHAEKLAALGEFAARIAHDIRNPVTAARSLAQQLVRAPAGTSDGEAAALILSELERVERQVAALLRFARRDEIRPETFDLGALAQATLTACRSRLEADAIAVTVEAADAVTVHADPEKVRQVLLNLVDNAADALRESPERRLVVTVAKANGTATLGVTDSGPGVADDALERLFEPFFTTKSHGTGLGLAIAQRTVAAHGGCIVAARTAAGGMTFRIELPVAITGTT